jgi:DNA-binding NarL/FixJ family response regulator
MSIATVLYISDKTVPGDPVTGALRNAGYEVVSADSFSEGVALLFLLRSVAAVVLHDRLGERNGVDVARSLRSIRPEVAIILLSPNQIDSLPPYVDASVSMSQPFDVVTSTVRHLLAAATACRVRRKTSSRCAAA